MNLFMYVRGHQLDYDYWVQLGNPGWDSETAWEYFKKSESNTFMPFVEKDGGKYHSDKGLMKVSFCNVTLSHEEMFIKANAELGLAYAPDVNGDIHIGTTDYQGTIYNGRRVSTATAFLDPIKIRPNLHVVKDAFVEKILIDDRNRARGVQYKYKGKNKRSAFARKEVILSAGAFMSPVILMHSGIGPAEQLDKYDIPVKVDLPVGEHLFDQIGSMTFFTFDATEPPSPTDTLDAVYDLAIHNTGRLTIIPQLGAFLNSDESSKVLADTQIAFVYFPVNSSASIQVMFESFDIRKEFVDYLIETNRVKDLGVDFMILLRPESRGYVRLNGSSPYDKPSINPNYFGSSEDLEKMVTIIERQMLLQETRQFQQYGSEILHIPIPECDVYRRFNREYLKCYTRYFSLSAYHPAGSCKMGPDWDDAAVVDPRLRVYNVDNLRVIDASV